MQDRRNVHAIQGELLRRHTLEDASEQQRVVLPTPATNVDLKERAKPNTALVPSALVPCSDHAGVLTADDTESSTVRAPLISKLCVSSPMTIYCNNTV